MKQILELAILFGALALSCAASTLQDYDAEYQILLNDKPVALAYFRLRITGPQEYLFEAYTTAAKTSAAGAPKDEILESSTGRLQDGKLKPSIYLYSVNSASGTQMFEQRFDWAKQKLDMQYGDVAQTATLDVGTQDRMSYLLQLVQAVADAKSEFHFALAEPEHTDQLKFRARTKEQFTLPSGTVEATGVECFLDADVPDRVIWIAPDWNHIPVLIERTVANGRVRMELLNRRGGPIAADN